MAKIKDDYVFKLKGGEASVLESVNPFLERREPIVVFFENGQTNIKIGDGKNNYNSLPFISDTNIDVNDVQGLTSILHQHEIDLENLNDRIDKIDKIVIDIETDIVGRKTVDNGEIFNDYENNTANTNAHSEGEENTAGGKAFKILSFNAENKSFTLDSTEGLEIGDEYSCQLNANFDFVGKIVEITTNSIIVDNIPIDHDNEWNVQVSENSKLWIPSKPTVGNYIIGTGSHGEGGYNIVNQVYGHTEGYNNITGGKYGHTEGRGNKAGYAAHAENQDNIAAGVRSHAQNYQTQALGEGSSTGGHGTVAKEKYQDVIGTFNKDNPQAISIVGNGVAEDARNNAFEVLKDGSANIDKQGYLPNSIVQFDYLKNNYQPTFKYVENFVENNISLKVDNIAIGGEVTITSDPISNITIYNKNVLAESFFPVIYTYGDSVKYESFSDRTMMFNGVVPQNSELPAGYQWGSMVFNTNIFVLPEGRYRLSGLPEISNLSGLTLKVRQISPKQDIAICNASQKYSEFTIAEGGAQINIMITLACGTILDNVLFKPMIELLSEENSSTDDVKFIKSEIVENYAINNNSITFNSPFDSISILLTSSVLTQTIACNYQTKVTYPIVLADNGTAELTKMGETDNAIATKGYVDEKPGQKTAEGGEIFNDYEINKALTSFSHAEGVQTIAGTYAFNILAWNETNKTYTLDSSIEELTVGDVFSVKWKTSHIDCGKIEEIDVDTKTITVDNIIINSDYLSEPKKLFIIQKPELGTESFDQGAHAEGLETQAVLNGAHAEGGETKALDRYSHAEGRGTIAKYSAHAEGYQTKALGDDSHSEGKETQATAIAAHAEGVRSVASAIGSHAGGVDTRATAQGQTAIGRYNDENPNALFIVGNGIVEDEKDDDGNIIIKNRKNAFTVNSNGTATIQTAPKENMDIVNKQYVDNITANLTGGVGKKKSGGEIFNDYTNNTAAGYSHAEGTNTSASGWHSHAEGAHTTSSGAQSHAEGAHTTASAQASHAEGWYTQATKTASHAGGYKTIASVEAQTAIGKFNDENESALFIVGNGIAEDEKDADGNIITKNRKNAFMVNKDGSAEIQTIGISPNSVVTKEYVDSAIGGIETVLDTIIAIQNSFIGGATE